MSHAPERKEKDCLNCGTTVIGHFCHICGQENVVPKESFTKLVLHFFYDITHFDGKFFHSLQFLLFRPGFLSKEYVRGRRASYLNPVRMYVFTSAIFFLVFFIIVDPRGNFKINIVDPLSNKERVDLAKELEAQIKKSGPDTSFLAKKLERLKDTTRPVSNSELLGLQTKHKTFAEYDSLQKTLTSKARDGWFGRLMVKKFELNKEFQENPENAGLKWAEIFLHKLPYLLFVSLPLFALILKLLYVRRKQFFYADHAIFSIHHYIFSFILLLLFFLVSSLYNRTGLGVLRVSGIILIILWPIYLYIALFNFYKQGWFKTFVKFVLINMLGLVSLVLLFVIFFFITVLMV